MKKLLTLLFLLVPLFLMAQEASTYDQEIDYEQSWRTYTTTSNATTATDSIWYYTFLKESHSNSVFYQIKIDLDSVSGTAVPVPVVLQTKLWDSDTFTAIDTVTWGAGSDTVITFTNIASASFAGTWPSFTGTILLDTSSMTALVDTFDISGSTADSSIAIVTDTLRYTTTLTPLSSSMALTSTGVSGLSDRYYRIYIKTANKGFVIKVSELSIRFTE